MANPNPAVLVSVNGGAAQATPPQVLAPSGASIVVSLVDRTGVDSWTLQCFGSDETSATADIAPNTNILANQSTFTLPIGTGKAWVIRSTVKSAQVNQSYASSFKIAIPTGAGLAVAALGETLETDVTYQNLPTLNAAIRTAGPQAVETTTPFNVPAVTYTTTFDVRSAYGIPAGSYVAIAGAGTFFVVSTGATSIVIRNDGATGNATGGTNVDPGALVVIAGPPGANGTNGGPGPTGSSLLTTTTANFTMPAVGSTVANVPVANAGALSQWQPAWIPGAGEMQVTAIGVGANAGTVTLMNLGGPHNAAAPVTILSGASIYPGGGTATGLAPGATGGDLTLSNFLAAGGGSVASTGAIRTAQGTFWYAAGGGTNYPVLGLDANNAILVGTNANPFSYANGSFVFGSTASTPNAVFNAANYVSFNVAGVAGVNVYATSLYVNTPAITFGTAEQGNTVTIGRDASPSDSPTADILFQGQAPYATATTNKASGNLRYNIQAPVSGGTYGKHRVQVGGTDTLVVSQDSSSKNYAAVTGYLAVGPAATTFPQSGDVRLGASGNISAIQYSGGSQVMSLLNLNGTGNIYFGDNTYAASLGFACAGSGFTLYPSGLVASANMVLGGYLQLGANGPWAAQSGTNGLRGINGAGWLNHDATAGTGIDQPIVVPDSNGNVAIGGAATASRITLRNRPSLGATTTLAVTASSFTPTAAQVGSGARFTFSSTYAGSAVVYWPSANVAANDMLVLTNPTSYSITLYIASGANPSYVLAPGATKFVVVNDAATAFIGS